MILQKKKQEKTTAAQECMLKHESTIKCTDIEFKMLKIDLQN